jgi:hypothetical protein
MASRTPLSGLIAKGNSHKHIWQKTEKIVNGTIFKLHVCMEHKNKEGKIEPVIKAYDCERMK